MTSKNNPEAKEHAESKPPVADAPAPVEEAPAETAPEGNPPVVDGIIRLRDANGALHDYSIDDFSEAKSQEVYALLPKIWQGKIDAQAAFFQNYSRTITEIPEELRAPGAIEKLFAEISKNGGYAADTTSPAVKAFLEGPSTAELRNSGLYKGYKTADALSELAASGLKIAGAVPGQYIDMLALPVRGAAYALNSGLDWMGDKLTVPATLSPEKAYTLATAYQGMMYMATESEFAPKETKTSAPGAAGTAVGGIQSFFSYTAVAGIAVWNLVKGWFTGEKTTWDQAWKDAENYWTEGKGLQSAAETAQTNAVAGSIEEVRPAVEERLRQATIAGMDISSYLNLKPGELIADDKGNVSSFEGQDAGIKPVLGPDGKTQLNASAIEQNKASAVTGDLFKDWSTTGLTASGIAVGAGALTHKGVGQGFARTTVMGDRPGLEKSLKAANTRLNAATEALEAFKKKEEHTNWRGKPLADEAVEKTRKGLEATLEKAEGTRNQLASKLANFSTDPIGDAKGSSSWGKRKLGELAEGADHKLAPDAGRLDKTKNLFTKIGRPFGAGVAHVSGWGTNFASGVASGTASVISPDDRGPSVKPFFGQKAKEGAEAISNLSKNGPSGFWGGAGKFLGFGGTALAGLSTFATPVVGIATSEDAVGTGTYALTGAGMTGAAWAAGGKQLGLKALGVGVRRIVPGAGLVADGVDYFDGNRTDNSQKKRDAAVSAATQGVGAFIGGGIGAVAGFFGGFGIGAAPAGIAGATIGTTVGGFASMVTVPLANRLWPVKAEPKDVEPQRTTQPPKVAAVVTAREPIANLQLTQEEINTIVKSRMAVSSTGTGKTGFDAVAFARVGSASAAAARNS